MKIYIVPAPLLDIMLSEFTAEHKSQETLGAQNWLSTTISSTALETAKIMYEAIIENSKEVDI